MRCECFIPCRDRVGAERTGPCSAKAFVRNGAQVYVACASVTISDELYYNDNSFRPRRVARRSCHELHRARAGGAWARQRRTDDFSSVQPAGPQELYRGIKDCAYQRSKIGHHRSVAVEWRRAPLTFAPSGERWCCVLALGADGTVDSSEVFSLSLTLLQNGIELQVYNHLGHHAFILPLLPLLEATAGRASPSSTRIILVTSNSTLITLLAPVIAADCEVLQRTPNPRDQTSPRSRPSANPTAPHSSATPSRSSSISSSSIPYPASSRLPSRCSEFILAQSRRPFIEDPPPPFRSQDSSPNTSFLKFF